MSTTIRVALDGDEHSDRSYNIAIAHGLIADAARFVYGRSPVSHVVVITDTGARPHADRVASAMSAGDIRCDLLAVPAGEASKSIEQAERLWSQLVQRRADRKTVIVAVGGGVVGDLAGFVAATFARGLGLFQVPTTLLAQVDSSVGGKVGINLPAAKNIIGAFWQPRGVLIDLDTLATLPDREYRSGLAEVVKYGVILDATFFEYLEQNAAQLAARDPATLEYVVGRSCRLKADVVERDERELTGLRAVLNYGHTFAHAIETTSGYGTYLHGEAVAIGMVLASRLAEALGRIDATVTRRQQSLLTQLGLPTALATQDAEGMLAAMHLDKKTEHGQLRFVLPSRLGHVELVGDVNPAAVRKILA
jgi:3-dehydroquinate synthase